MLEENFIFQIENGALNIFLAISTIEWSLQMLQENFKLIDQDYMSAIVFFYSKSIDIGDL